ncbi:hypothetical protein [Haloarcula amylolytica]|uniref:hypothetical protein n=1 Tax=Haloarcula amylolytica TaxID=396317 RepID=UPI003C73A8E7
MADEGKESSSLLTPQQREFLNGEQVSDSYKRKLQVRIRDRVREGILDAPLVFASDQLRDKDVREIFSVDPSHIFGRPEIAEGIVGLIALVYRGLRLNSDGDEPTEGFANQIEAGIVKALNREGVDPKRVEVKIDVDIGGEIDDLTPEELASKYSRDQMIDMLSSSVISDEDFAEFVRIQQERVESTEDED